MFKKFGLAALAASMIVGPALASDQMSTGSAKPATATSDSVKPAAPHKLKKAIHHKKHKKEATSAVVK